MERGRGGRVSAWRAEDGDGEVEGVGSGVGVVRRGLIKGWMGCVRREGRVERPRGEGERTRIAGEVTGKEERGKNMCVFV